MQAADSRPAAVYSLKMLQAREHPFGSDQSQLVLGAIRNFATRLQVAIDLSSCGKAPFVESADGQHIDRIHRFVIEATQRCLEKSERCPSCALSKCRAPGIAQPNRPTTQFSCALEHARGMSIALHVSTTPSVLVIGDDLAATLGPDALQLRG